MSKTRIVPLLCLFSALTLSAGVLPPVCVNSSGVYVSGTCATTGGVSSFSVDYNGFAVDAGTTYIIPGLSATATYSNFLFDAAANTVRFNVNVTNTSTIATNSRLNSLGFSTTPDPLSGTITNGSASNPYTTVEFQQTNYPNGIGNVDFCFESGNTCAAGSGGLTNGQSASFTATLTFTDITSTSTLLFQQFVDRYSAFTATVSGHTFNSATGVAVVPEPTTYAFLLSLMMSGVVLYRKRRSSEE